MKLIDNMEDFDPEQYLRQVSGEEDIEEALEKVIEYYLEDYSLENLLEEFDITPIECFLLLYRNDYISKEQIERFISVD